MNSHRQRCKYIVSDIVAAIAAWSIYFFVFICPDAHTPFTEQNTCVLSQKYLLGLLVFPLYWILIYTLSGYYHDVYRKSRLSELWQTLGNAFFGTVVLYLLLSFGNLFTLPYSESASGLFNYFLLQFGLTYLPRLILTTITTNLVHHGKLGFNTLLIGSSEKALETWREVMGQKRGSGNLFVGFVSVNNGPGKSLIHYLPHLGNLQEIREIIHQKNVEEVIIAIETSEHDMINSIINKLIDTRVIIKAIPSLYDILTGRVRMNSILGTPLILVSHNLMPIWQENVKIFLDYVIAFMALLISLPLCLFLAVGIKLTSKGPILYSHERIGRYGKPFTIYKFRSMVPGAEKDGPELSSKNDERITRFGRFMRKARLDEIPNFINVLKGEMSLVGPRPERKHFIDQIIQQAPHYLHLLKVKPGITSWGQVKYGYAGNVEQMIHRLKYDLIYLDNMSLIVDFKILIYTMLTIMKRKGI